MSLRRRSVTYRTTRTTFLLAALLLTLAACGGPSTPPTPKPPTGAGSRVLITSPAPGSSVSGAVYFAVQLLDPADLATLELRVGGTPVTHQYPGETPLRVFLIPRDHPEGSLELSARVGTGSSQVETKITVQVVHQPPSSASVGSNGALLGVQEASGDISTLVIPAGVATGASVEFEAMTQAEVKAATGVDYEALGVTFLGAQEVRSTEPTGDGVLIASGGFGPMVQTGQTVVNYRISPDMGRGVGELMVINGAGVAPNGDIVSNRPIAPQVGGVTAVNSLSAASVGPQQTTLPAGPPGTQLEFSGNGLNIYAPFGYVVRFTRGAQEVEVPAAVGLDGSGKHYLVSYVPELSPGTATVELVAVASGTAFASYTMSVTASPSVADPKALVDAALAGASVELQELASDLAGLGMSLDVSALQAGVASARAYWAGRPADDPELLSLARLVAGSGAVDQSSAGGPAASAALARPTQTSALCMLQARKYTFDKEFAAKAFKGDRFETGLRGLHADLTLGFLDRFADRLEDSEYECDPYKEVLCTEYGIGCEDGEEPDFGFPDEDSPNDPRPRPAPPSGGGPSDWVTGMGSLFTLGGPLGGSARGGGGGDGLNAPVLQPAASPTFEPGRYTVRVLVGGVTPWPFAAHIGADGYFYLPSLPTNDFSQLVITDQHTFAECVVQVQGRGSRSATAVSIDLDECLSEPIDPDEYTIVWVGTASQGSWTTASNWSPARVPDETDDVLIPSSTTRVNVSAGTYAVRSLRSLGTLSLNGATAFSASEDIALNWLQIGNSAATIQASGELNVDRLLLNTAYTLPETFTTFKSLYLDRIAAVLTFSHTLNVTESLTFVGTLGGSGRTVLMPGATATIGRSDQFAAYNGVLYDSHVLEIRGAAGFDGTNTRIQLNGTSRVEVAPGGVLDLDAAGSGIEGNSPTGTLVNDGTINVTAAGDHNVTPAVENHGTIDIAAGAVLKAGATARTFTNAGTITGAGTFFTDRFVAGSAPFTHQAGAVLDVDTLRIGSTINGASTVITGPLGVANLEIQNGLVTLTQDLTLERLLVHYDVNTTLAGTLSNSGTITVSEVLMLGAGTLAGSGTTVLASGGTLDLTIVRDRGVADTHTLINHGTATWGPMATRAMAIAAGAELQNRGTFIVRNDRPMSGGGVFRNFGELRKETAAGVSSWAICYVQESGGSVVEDSGSFDFTGGCSP